MRNLLILTLSFSCFWPTSDENDCLLLAVTALRRHQTRWLAIQADFANITGRLVPEDVLKYKLSGQDKPPEEEEDA